MGFPTMWYVRPAKPQTNCTYAQSDQSLCMSLECSMSVKLLSEQHLEFLSLKGGFTCLSESTHIKMQTLLEITCRCSFFLLQFFAYQDLC